MPKNDFFQPGELCGRHKILMPSAHGKRVQRYRAHDPAVDRPVLITCAKADRERWTARFEELAAKRAQIPSTPCVVDWGVTESGVFYIVEEDLGAKPILSLKTRSPDAPPEKAFRASMICCFALLFNLGEKLSEFAELGFWHGALDPVATLKLHEGNTVLEGLGFLQILGCAEGPELNQGLYLAPELCAGKPFDERADVFSVCALVLAMMRGEMSEAEALSELGGLAELFVWGMKREAADRPRWGELLPSIRKALGKLACVSGAQMERIAEALRPTDDASDAPKTQPRTPRTDAVVRREFAQTLRELSADQMGATVEKEWVWKEYSRPQILQDMTLKAPPSLKPPIPVQSTRPMESSEGEPITLRSIPFQRGRGYRIWAPLGMVAVAAAFVAWLGLYWLRRPEPGRLAEIQWPVIPTVFVNEPARPVEESAPKAERRVETAPIAPKRRAQKKGWTLCDVAACPPDGRALRD